MPRPAKFKKASDDKSGAALRERALERLKANWMLMMPHATWEAELEPRITPMLNSVDGGIAHCVEALRAHDEDDARLFLGVWDRCSATDRKYLKVEEIAHAAGVGALRLAEVVQTALFLYGNMQTQMMLAAGLPQIVSRSIKQAKTAKGLADREWMLKAGKILPIPKGAQIAIQNNLRASTGARPVGAVLWLEVPRATPEGDCGDYEPETARSREDERRADSHHAERRNGVREVDDADRDRVFITDRSIRGLVRWRSRERRGNLWPWMERLSRSHR